MYSKCSQLNCSCSRVINGRSKQQFSRVPTPTLSLWLSLAENLHFGFPTYLLESHQMFNPSQSSTYKSTGQNLSIHYGTGDMEGTVGCDTVTVSVTVASQWLLLCLLHPISTCTAMSRSSQ